MYKLYYVFQYRDKEEDKKIFIGDYENFHDAEHDTKKIQDVLEWVSPALDVEIVYHFAVLEKDGQKICETW
jgi:hypothetical protein